MLYESLINTFEAQTFDESKSLTSIRNQALNIFKKQGFPTIKNEEWRFTNIQPYVQKSYTTTLDNSLSDKDIEDAISNYHIKGLDAYRLVLVNGNIHPKYSVLPNNNDFFVTSIRDFLKEDTRVAQLNHHLNIEQFPFAALNTALFQNGYAIHIKKNATIDKPLYVLHLFYGSKDTCVQPRNQIQLERGANFELIEAYHCLGDTQYFVNGVTEIHVASNAHCNHTHFQQNAKNQRFVYHVQVTQQAHSRYDNYTITIPQADIVRNHLNVVLDGVSTETHMYGLYLAGNKQLIDNHSLVEHRHPHCESNQLYKGVILNGGKGVFNGKIHVYRPAQKTNAFQQNNNLLFGENAQINTKPQLEIFADDVKCSHGSTIGQFNKESLFYLQSRGIGKEAARTMLVNAFAFDVTEKINNDAIRHYLNHLIEHTLAEHKEEI